MSLLVGPEDGPGIGLAHSLPRWTQVCPDGHFNRERSFRRPQHCYCGLKFVPPRPINQGRARKKLIGHAAVTAIGDGWAA